ncbi:hypothetical protein M0R04_07370 [Candidatus Dojkabacteria bacterium]|jgi:hypothetical protein|nr:hypothetical protein [Candidatus Dojkabacteria bacterium]
MIYQLLSALQIKYPTVGGRSHHIKYNEEYDSLELVIWFEDGFYSFDLDQGDLDDIPSLLCDIDCWMKEMMDNVYYHQNNRCPKAESSV